MSITSIWAKKPPVTYTIVIEQHPETGVSAFVQGISDDPKSRQSALWALAEAARDHMNATQIHQAMLSRVNALMDTNDPAELAELSRLAWACQAYENPE